MEAEELEQNLRRFAMRQASAASKEFSDLKSRVVVSVQSSPSRHCPMHGRHGNFQVQPQQPQSSSSSASGSRKEMARELRLSAAKEAREARERSIEGPYTVHTVGYVVMFFVSLHLKNVILFSERSQEISLFYIFASKVSLKNSQL